MTGLCRVATNAAIYNTARTRARPPRILCRPPDFPLSLLKSQTPINALISRRLSVPISATSASSEVAVKRPTPGIDCMIAALCCHSRLARIDWSKSLSASFKRFSSQLKILRSQARMKFRWKLPMQSLTDRHSAHLPATKNPERRTSASVRMNCTAQRLPGRTE